MEVVEKASDQLRGYTGGNPFGDVQARMMLERKVSTEFFATSLFYSRFNEGHEILVGTRGSGKTFLLKMLSYHMLRQSANEELRVRAKEKLFIGFYIPLHLEFLNAFSEDIHPRDLTEYFQFCLNCAAATSLLREVSALLDDQTSGELDRIERERAIVQDLAELWQIPSKKPPRDIQDLEWHITLLYAREVAWKDRERYQLPPLAKRALVPIVPAVERVCWRLGIDPKDSRWLACVDEAEFLAEPFVKCLNTFLRSDSGPIVVKIATLPNKHRSLETLEDGVYIRDKGNDFSYRRVDMKWDSLDFERFTDHVIRERLKRSGIDCHGLGHFLGVHGHDDLLDYFAKEFGESMRDQSTRLAAILQQLSVTRRENYQTDSMPNEIVKRFSPVYYVRMMKARGVQGNTTPGWFAGAHVVRRVCEGNPRRFLQLMEELVTAAVSMELTPKNQHRTITAFCRRELSDAVGLPERGALARELLQTVGGLLERKVHGQIMVDAGCGFRLSPALAEQKEVREAIELLVSFSHVVEVEWLETAPADRELRLSFLHAVNFWLPMRLGYIYTISAKGLQERTDTAIADELLTRQLSQAFVKHLQLGLFEGGDSDD